MEVENFRTNIQMLFLFLLFGAGACQTTINDKGGVLTNLLQLENTDTLSFPIVDNFDQIAPLFNQHNDTTYVINFWATWCAPCVEEFPYFERLAKEMEEDAVEVVMISLNYEKQIRTDIPLFINTHNVQLPVLALIAPNPHIWLKIVDQNWGGSLPVTLIYRNDERYFLNGAFPSYEALEEAVAEIGLRR